MIAGELVWGAVGVGREVHDRQDRVGFLHQPGLRRALDPCVVLGALSPLTAADLTDTEYTTVRWGDERLGVRAQCA